MAQLTRLVTSIAMALLLSSPAAAKKNNPNITLKYVPQQAVNSSYLSISPEARDRSVRIRVIDARGGDDPSKLGTRTDDDDRLYTLVAVNEVLPFVEQSLDEIARQATLSVQDDATLELVTRLTELRIKEVNQAVGATFESWVRFDAELVDGAGNLLWTGSGWGDATRWGKKFSNANCNEVLSDAMLEAFASVVNNRPLQKAWATGEPAPSRTTIDTSSSRSESSSSRSESSSSRSESSATTSSGPPKSPAVLLTEIQDLMDEGFGADTLVEFVKQSSLNRKMGAGDMKAWKEAGVPEVVIREALKLPVR